MAALAISSPRPLPRSSAVLGGLTLDLKTPDSESPTSAKSSRSAGRSSKNTGGKSRAPRTSRKSPTPTPSLPLTSGLEDSLAKMSLWQGWGRDLGLKGDSLDSFTSFIDWLSSTCPEFWSSKTFQVCSLPTKDEISLSSYDRWPTSGIAWDGVCLTAKTSESPSHVKECSLLELIETGEVPQKYFLSPNAAKGILRRADRMERVLFPPLRKALEILSKAQS